MIEGEALALDTLVPSPDGWTTMGALRAGDQVFAGDGSVCRVIEAFPVLTNRPCYRMTIEGAEVIADARHKWVTSTRDERGYVGRDGYPKERYEQVRTTEDVAKDLKCNGLWPSTNHAIRAVSITGSGSDNLPVPAYTLGYWLGDGSSRSAHITSHPEDQPFIVERIAEDGYETRLSLGQDRRGYTFLVKRLSRDLRAANVIKNKRIPDEYFWASQEQRLALVQGLMDSDGTISERGQFEFSNKNPRLISGMVALLSSLGVKCRVVWRPSGQARVRGTTNLPIFSLPRKSERIPAHRTERDWRYIQNVESVDTVDVRCIKVDSEDNTFLVTEHFIRTHNSGVLATAAPGQRPEWEPSKKKLTWPNGAIGHAFSGEEPDRLRGPQHSAAWVDEPAHIPLIEDVWSNLLFGLRVGAHPRVCATTTPLPTKWMKAIVADPTTRLVRASTYANIDNLPPHFAKIILDRYEGTRLGRQEIHGEILADVEGALWQYEMFDGDQRIDIAPFDLDRVVVGVDPAGTARSKSDETGIVVVGFKDERFYVLADLSGKYSPEGLGRPSQEGIRPVQRRLRCRGNELRRRHGPGHTGERRRHHAHRRGHFTPREGHPRRPNRCALRAGEGVPSLPRPWRVGGPVGVVGARFLVPRPPRRARPRHALRGEDCRTRIRGEPHGTTQHPLLRAQWPTRSNLAPVGSRQLMNQYILWAVAALVGIVASARFTRLIVADSFPPVVALRMWWAGRFGDDRWGLLLTCPWCFAPYAIAVDMAAALLTDLHPAWWVINGWLAASYAASWIVFHDED
jgi:hypothetical protein